MVLECVLVQVFISSQLLVALGVPPLKNVSKGHHVENEEGVESEMAVQTVEVSRCPGGLEELGSDGITSCPSNDCLSSARNRTHVEGYSQNMA